MFSKSKALIAFFFLLFVLELEAQEVSNVQAKFNSGKAMITYDLDQSVPAYFVELLYSSDGGMTFSDPLKRISGDAINVNSGAGKRIIWDAEDEIGYFSGDMIFRVKANVRTKKMPGVVEEEKFTAEVKSAYSTNGILFIELILTPKMDTELGLKGGRSSSYIINQESLTQQVSTEKSHGKEWFGTKKLLKGIPIEIEMQVENFPENHTLIPKLTVNYYYTMSAIPFSIVDIPVTILD
jgi:hypothetical protein